MFKDPRAWIVLFSIALVPTCWMIRMLVGVECFFIVFALCLAVSALGVRTYLKWTGDLR